MITFRKHTFNDDVAYVVLYDDYVTGVIRCEYGEWLFFPHNDQAYDAKMLRSVAAAIDAIEAHQQPKDDEE